MQESIMSAYRQLMYNAFLEIRSQGYRGRSSITDEKEEAQRGAKEALEYCHWLADWLHNLALFSFKDFEGFDEAWFWSDGSSFASRYPVQLRTYKKIFRISCRANGEEWFYSL